MNTKTQSQPIISESLLPRDSTVFAGSSGEQSKQATQSEAPRRMKPVRFAVGLLSTTIGMIIILLVGVRMLEIRQLGGSFALPLILIAVLSGVMLLGGGFGLMATASSGFDEQEFDRLMKAGNMASATVEPVTMEPVTVGNETIYQRLPERHS